MQAASGFLHVFVILYIAPVHLDSVHFSCSQSLVCHTAYYFASVLNEICKLSLATTILKYLSGFFLAVLQHSREMLELLILFCFSNVWALYSLSLIHGKRPNLKFTCWCVSWCQLFSFSDWLGQMWTVALFFLCPDISLSWVPNKKTQKQTQKQIMKKNPKQTKQKSVSWGGGEGNLCSCNKTNFMKCRTSWAVVPQLFRISHKTLNVYAVTSSGRIKWILNLLQERVGKYRSKLMVCFGFV